MFNVNDFKIEEWKQAGIDWAKRKFDLDGIELNGKYYEFNPKQREFINARERFVLASGGRGSGKTTAMLIKLLILSLFFPNNRILLGRNTLADIERATLPDFFDICPVKLFDHNKKGNSITFVNGSEIILMGLEALQSGPKAEIKKAEQKVKSLNLGGFFIDQCEEISERVFTSLRACLRRGVPLRQASLTANPADWWGYNFFVANPPLGLDKKTNKTFSISHLVECSTFDNQKNLPQDYIDDLMANKDKDWIDRYVHGIWDPVSRGEARVFPEELIKYLTFYLREPLRLEDGIEIFKEKDNTKHYVVGVDPSDGSVDPCGIKVFEKETGEEAASYSGFIPESQVAEKALKMAEMYETRTKPMMIIESNRSAAIELLKTRYDNFYEQEIFNYRERRKTKKLGWYSSWASKKILISNFENLLGKQYVKIHCKKTYKEFSSFIWSNEVRKMGAGAKGDNHDDLLLSTMLSFIDFKPINEREEKLKEESDKIRSEKNRTKNYQYT